MEGTYHTGLVGLSIVIAIIASYAALDIATHLSTAKGKFVYFWLFGGAFAMGAGIWSMHFIGMLAFKLPIPMSYDIGITILSLVIAIIISGCALWVMKSPRISLSIMMIGATLVGLGICSMHYVGMEAMRMFPAIEYDPVLVTASVIIAIFSSFMALELAFRINRTHTLLLIFAKFGSAIALGLGIAGMHYTAMAAASYPPDSICRAAETGGIDNFVLAINIAVVISIIIFITILITSAMDAHFANVNATLATNLKKANEELENSNIELQRFAYVASHDLQSPLRNISIYIDLLQSKCSEKLDDKENDWVNRITQNTKQLRSLIQDLLEYSRIDSQTSPFKTVNIKEIFDNVVSLHETSINDLDAKVSSDELPTVKGNPSQLTHLMLNLIGNSLKYHSAEKPQIHVSAEHVDNIWILSVSDNGIGINKKFHQKIFEIFSRLHSEDMYHGNGIGLAVCRRVVQNHGGKIWLESEPGKGSKFYFTISDTI